MIQMQAEAEPCSPHAIIDDGPRTNVLELSTLTAVVLDAWRHSDGRHAARLNAYVDGLGHRTLVVELTAEGYEQAVSSLQRSGVLVRCVGILVDEAPSPHLLAVEGLQLLLPHGSR